jgi:Cu(I)/Ag(I) efflux system protein CusF
MTKFFKSTVFMCVLSCGLCWGVTGTAQTALQNAPTSSSATVFTEAEVKKVDLSTGKVTLRHGEIKSLDMPPMTMVFTVKDKALLQGVAAGDQVRFVVVSENGKLVITELLK